MKIGLIGYGKMGKEVEKISLSLGHEIVAKIAHKNESLLPLSKSDVAIQFVRGEECLKSVKASLHYVKHLVIGTTDWQDNEGVLHAIAKEHNSAILHGSNFSFGMMLFSKIVSNASRMMRSFPMYEPFGVEYHHKEKKDAPSGTAKELSQKIEKEMRTPCDFQSIRGGHFPGTHFVYFDSPFDMITLKHSARNREGFARGAIESAKWLIGKQGVYTFEECFEDLITRETQ